MPEYLRWREAGGTYFFTVVDMIRQYNDRIDFEWVSRTHSGECLR